MRRRIWGICEAKLTVSLWGSVAVVERGLAELYGGGGDAAFGEKPVHELRNEHSEFAGGEV